MTVTKVRDIQMKKLLRKFKREHEVQTVEAAFRYAFKKSWDACREYYKIKGMTRKELREVMNGKN